MKQPLVQPQTNLNDDKLQELVLFFNETLGFCPNSVKTMFHRPEIAYAFVNLNKAVMENHGRVTSGLKRLIGYVSSNATGCRYCQAHTIRAAERYSVPQEQLDNIWEFRTHDSFSLAEKAALEFSIAASLVPNAVTDEIAQEMRKHWNEGEIVEILGVVSLFGYLNRWNDSMGTELESPARESGENLLAKDNWSVGKHAY
jgi:uncharacterized peroxidase-related enzyme